MQTFLLAGRTAERRSQLGAHWLPGDRQLIFQAYEAPAFIYIGQSAPSRAQVATRAVAWSAKTRVIVVSWTADALGWVQARRSLGGQVIDGSGAACLSRGGRSP